MNDKPITPSEEPLPMGIEIDIKNHFVEVIDLLTKYGEFMRDVDPRIGRRLSIAITHAENSMLWALYALNDPET